MNKIRRLTEILLVEDNDADARLVREVLKDTEIPSRLNVVRDGADAMDFLHNKNEHTDAPRPDIILLDLNLPKKDGRQVLAEIKQDNGLKNIPVVILTTSTAEEDVTKTYSLYANCYITKPVSFEQFAKVIKSIEEFWLTIVRLPGCEVDA